MVGGLRKFKFNFNSLPGDKLFRVIVRFYNVLLYWGAIEDGMQVTHHQNPYLKNTEHYINDVSKHNAICLIYYSTK